MINDYKSIDKILKKKILQKKKHASVETCFNN